VDLNISRIYGITDSSVKSVARNCRNLKKLNVRECWRLSDNSMKMLLEYCKSLKVSSRYKQVFLCLHKICSVNVFYSIYENLKHSHKFIVPIPVRNS